MATTMKAAVVRAFGKPLVIEDVPVPVPGPGEVLVRIVASGVCHTDLHAANGDWPVKPSPPFIPGHEGAGVVAALGPGVANLKEGDNVGIAWLHDACGQCEYCRSGYFIFCSNRRGMGHGVNGAFTRYVLMRPDQLYRIPENFSLDEAAMSEPFAAVVQAVTEIER